LNDNLLYYLNDLIFIPIDLLYNAKDLFNHTIDLLYIIYHKPKYIIVLLIDFIGFINIQNNSHRHTINLLDDQNDLLNASNEFLLYKYDLLYCYKYFLLNKQDYLYDNNDYLQYHKELVYY
jgi:hypothetical protein